MEAAPPVEAVIQAVSSLYTNPDPKVKDGASKWLNQLQQSVFAWTISDQLLQRNVDVNTCYFAAQTMRTKIQYSFHELPPASHASLRSSLLQHLTQLSPGTSQVILTQLCLAMADLILLMPDWATALPELMTALGPPQPHTPALLEVLLLLPEEVDSRHLRLGANRRQQVKEMLSSSYSHVTQFLGTLVTSSATSAQLVSCVKCYSSWLTLGVIPLDTVLASPVMGMAVASLQAPQTAPELHEAATDCMIALLARLEREDSPQLEQSTVTTVQQLAPSYQTAVAEEDLEKCLNLCRVFTELGETFLMKIVSAPPQQPHFSVPVLDMVLLCCQHPDYEIPDVTFNLWYRLSEELYTRNDDAMVAVFKPQIETLINTLCRHCQIEPDTVRRHLIIRGNNFNPFILGWNIGRERRFHRVPAARVRADQGLRVHRGQQPRVPRHVRAAAGHGGLGAAGGGAVRDGRGGPQHSARGGHDRARRAAAGPHPPRLHTHHGQAHRHQAGGRALRVD